MNELMSAGINLGYGVTKVKTDKGFFKYLSDVNRAASRRFQEKLGIEATETQIVVCQGVQYEVGEGASLTSAPRERKTIFPKWAGTETYMVLQQSILDRLALEGTDWVVTLGVPIDEMRDEAYTDLVRSLWIGEHKTASGPITIHAALVAAEPSGALFYYGTNEVEFDVLKKQNLTIWDFGYLTTLGTTHRRLVIDEDNTVHIDRGVSKVVECASKLIRDEYRELRDIVEIEMAMLGRWPLSIDSEEIDVTPFISHAIEREGPKIINRMKNEMPKPAKNMYLGGGGSVLFGPMVTKEYSDHRVIISDKPQDVNAWGLWYISNERRAAMMGNVSADEPAMHE